MLRKKLFFLLIFTVTLTALKGQTFHGGIRGGLTASEVSGDNLASPNKTGWFASFFTLTPISDYSHLSLDIMYIQKGSRSVPDEKNNYYDYRFSLHYVETPLLIQTDISRFTNHSFFEKITISTGLSLSVLVEHTETTDGFSGLPNYEPPAYNKAELNFLMAIAFPVTDSFDFRITFSNGLTPIRPHSSGGKTLFNAGQYNTVWSFGVSYTIW